MLFPHSRQQHTDKMKEDHQLAITGIQREHQLFIENWNNQIQTIHYENVALQAQRDVYQAQLQRCQDQIYGLIIDVMSLVQMFQGKDNIVMIIIKHTSLKENEFYEYPYYITRI